MVVRYLLVLLILVPGSQGLVVLTDEAGDVRIDPAGVDPSGETSATDLLSLEIEETPTTFRFTLDTGSESSLDSASDVYYSIQFRVGTAAYDLVVDRWGFYSAFGGAGYTASLYRQDEPGGNSWRVGSPHVQANPATGLAVVDLQRHWLDDQDHVEAASGDVLTEVRVTAREIGPVLVDLGQAVASDRMPDAGAGRYEVVLGAPQQGDIRLTTDERIRGSNGAATTYVWRINVTNMDENFSHEVTFSLLDVPAAWKARTPLPRAEVPAGESIEVPVLVTVPFLHQHGAIDTFVLEARSLRGTEHVGRLQLGIEYLSTPQPAGHHDTVYLHNRVDRQPQTASVLSFGYTRDGPSLGMNSLEVDPQDDGTRVPGQVTLDSESRAMRAGWVVPLDPALRLGLDFDLTATGTLDLELAAPLPWSDGLLEGYLLLEPTSNTAYRAADYDGFPGVEVLADVGPVNVGALGTSSQRVTAPIAPRATADLVPHEVDQNLVLLLWLHGDGVPPSHVDQSPTLAPGTAMRLPVDEYHDPIDAKFSAPAFLSVALNGSTERYLAPGTGLLYELLLGNAGSSDLSLVAEAEGSNMEWVHWPAGAFHDLAANDTTTIPVAVRAPQDARIGDQVDVVLEAFDEHDPRIRGLIRIVATVTPDGGQILPEADQSEQISALEGEQESAAPAAGVLVVAVSLAVWMSRRRL